MLKNKIENNLDRGRSPTIPDPWENSSPAKEISPVFKTWELFPQPQPSIAPAGSINAPKLPTHQPTSIEILLEDELKLRAVSDRLLKPQLDKALALIYWLEISEN